MNLRKFAGFASLVVVTTLALSMPVVAKEWGKDKDKDQPKASAAAADTKGKSPEEIQKKAFTQQVMANISALNVQQVTVQVLQMQMQKELNALQQTQAVFCDTFNLDINKFRQGRYRFDEKEGKFIEQEPTALPPSAVPTT